MLWHGLKSNCIFFHFYLRNLTFRGILELFLFVGGWSFWIDSVRDFNGVIVFFLYNVSKKFYAC